MSGNTGDILERYVLKSERSRTPNEAYRAYGPETAHQRETKLQIRLANGMVTLLPYSYLVEVLCTSHQYLSLIYTHCVITLEGRHLNKLIELFQDDKIRWIQCFHPEQFSEVSKDQIAITKIERQKAGDF